MAHPAERKLGVVDFRSMVSRGFSAPAVVIKDLLSGFERPSPGSLFDFLLVRGALGRGSRAYSSAG